ncbi:MAG: DUF1447 family protein [Bacillaceae bacterium]|nr:DUF1447 family protein [Bacillaceae bacterium]
MPYYKVLYWNQGERFVREELKTRYIQSESVHEIRRNLKDEPIVIERIAEMTEADIEYEKKMGRM